MPDDGFQVVMFTHQDPEVWADVGLTLWAAGLQVSAAWTVRPRPRPPASRAAATTSRAPSCLVLRKRHGDRRGDLSDLYPDIQAEVKRPDREMLALDDKEEPNFGDADYQLAAYAAALRVLTGYSAIDEIDVQKELRRPRKRGERLPLARLIAQAVRIASDYLVPHGLDRADWRKLGPEERLYLKAIQIEAGGEAREGVYQELARGLRRRPPPRALRRRAGQQGPLQDPDRARPPRPAQPRFEAGFRGSAPPPPPLRRLHRRRRPGARPARRPHLPPPGAARPTGKTASPARPRSASSPTRRNRCRIGGGTWPQPGSWRTAWKTTR